MVGSELASQPQYLLNRAEQELNVNSRLGKLAMRIAPLYLSCFGVPEVGVHVRIRHALANMPRQVDSIVDLGCGAGFLLGAVHRGKRARTIAGVDIDEESIAVARATHPYADISCGNLLDFEGGPFDLAVSIDVLEHMSDADVPRFFQKAYSLLKPGGLLIVHTPAIGQRRHFKVFKAWEHHDHQREGFTRPDLTKVAQASGFQVNRCVPTFGSVAALCWELNMLLAGGVLQSVAFPWLNGIAQFFDRSPSEGNGILLTATRENAQESAA